MARATAVQLTGPVFEPYSFALGRYERSTEMCQDRYVYEERKAVLDGEDPLAMWWADGAWYVGKADKVGKHAGFLTAKENTDVPEDVAVAWKVASADNGWVEVPAVKCLIEEDFAATTSAALTDALSVVYITGVTPHGHVNHFCLGEFKRQPRAGEWEERYTYRKEATAVGPALVLWCVVGVWYVGVEEDIYTRRGLLMVEDAAVLPESIRACWQVGSEEGFIAAPGVSCKAEPDPATVAESEAAEAAGVAHVIKALHPFTIAVAELTMQVDGPTANKVTVNALKKAFETFDLNGDGRLDASELLAILTRKSTGSALDMEDAEELVRTFDVNGDGGLDLEEFILAMTGETMSGERASRTSAAADRASRTSAAS
jgi:hypothetical protein